MENSPEHQLLVDNNLNEDEGS